jgi:hypothetical protein
VFRTSQDGPVGADLRTGIAEAEDKVAFEIDSLGIPDREGWFVFIHGAAHHVSAIGRRTLASRGEGTLRSDYPHLDHRLAYRPDRENAVAQASPHWHGVSRATKVAGGGRTGGARGAGRGH